MCLSNKKKKKRGMRLGMETGKLNVFTTTSTKQSLSFVLQTYKIIRLYFSRSILGSYYSLYLIPLVYCLQLDCGLTEGTNTFTIECEVCLSSFCRMFNCLCLCLHHVFTIVKTNQPTSFITITKL